MKRMITGVALALLFLGQLSAQEPNPLSIGGYLGAGAIWNIDEATIGMTGGSTIMPADTRLRLNMNYTNGPTALKSRGEFRYNGTTYNSWVTIAYAYGSFDFAQKMAKVSMGRVRSSEFALKYYWLDDNQLAGYYSATDGLELLLKPIEGLTIGGFLPISATPAVDVNQNSFGRADINLSYKVKDLFNLSLGYLGGESALNVNDAYVSLAYLGMKEFQAGLHFINRYNIDTSAMVKNDINATLKYSMDALTVAEDFYVSLVDGADPMITSNTFVKYLIKGVDEGMDMEPRLDFTLMNDPNAVLDQNQTVIGVAPSVKLIMGKSDLTVKYLFTLYSAEFANGNPVQTDNNNSKLSIQYYINF